MSLDWYFMKEQSDRAPSENQTPDSQPMIQAWLEALTADSTVGELPAFEATVRPDLPTKLIDRELGASPDLPGVVIAADGELLGMVSRATLLAQLSRPFGQELYLNRPIKLMLEAEREKPLVLTGDLLVSDAAHFALQRPANRVYDPVVVSDENRFRLLDVHTLLMAQSRLLALANETIRSQVEVADAANQAKSVFLAHMSHEIRTPLTAILGFSENLLEQDTTEDERTTAVKTILRNGQHLLQLINDILDLSKIEAGRMEVERLRFSPAELVSDVISALQVRAEAKHIGLKLIYDGPIPESIESDPTRLRQILINLVGNAVKFTEEGQVTVRMKMVDAQGRSCLSQPKNQVVRLQCDVIDSGIGMTDEQIGRLFTSFMQADQSTSRKFGGTGLGLSISRRLAVLLGGDIVVTSRMGVGSTFTVTVEASPVAGAAWLDHPTDANKSARGSATPTDMRLTGRILLAEDGPDNQILIGTFLRKNGAEVTIVDNGRKAVDAALQSLKDSNPFAIVLMDMQMPIMDGYTATGELRAHGWTRPIMALTANVMRGDVQKCLESGCDDVASKPILRAKLIEQIQRLTAGAAKTGSAAEAQSDLSADKTAETVQFDVEAALEQVGGDDSLLNQVVEMLIQIAPGWLDSLERHLKENDAASSRRVAHSLKNSAENLGIRSVGESLLKLETEAAKGSLDKARELWPECRRKYDQLLATLQRYLQDNASTNSVATPSHEPLRASSK